jgi:hypothetical protein
MGSLAVFAVLRDKLSASNIPKHVEILSLCWLPVKENSDQLAVL